MANAAFYAHYPLPERFVPLPLPSRASLVSKGFLSGDGKVVPRTYAYFYAGESPLPVFLFYSFLISIAYSALHFDQ